MSQLDNVKAGDTVSLLVSANILLNVKCNRTNQPIELGEVVKFYNWGSDGEFIGYGYFDYDSFERVFGMYSVDDSSEDNRFSLSIDSNYDLFRAGVQKLTKKDEKILQDNGYPLRHKVEL